eukprot:9283886-Prorocentrum_lima.AAC.1
MQITTEDEPVCEQRRGSRPVGEAVAARVVVLVGHGAIQDLCRCGLERVWQPPVASVGFPSGRA